MQLFVHALCTAVTLSCLCWLMCQGQDGDCEPTECANGCEFGYQYDEHDCPTCSCHPDPCLGHECPPSEVCTAQTVMCIRAPCYPVANCSPRRKGTGPCVDNVRCTNGDVWDRRLCKCVITPCATVKCSAGSECKVVPSNCRSRPCSPSALCVPTGPCVDKVLCINGNVWDPRLCKCVLTPCATVKCAAGNECKVVPSNCRSPPCSPSAICVPTVDRCPPADPCAIRCAYGLKYDKNCCQLCECNDDPCTNYQCPDVHQVCQPVANTAATSCDPPFKAACFYPPDK